MNRPNRKKHTTARRRLAAAGYALSLAGAAALLSTPWSVDRATETAQEPTQETPTTPNQ